MKLTLIGILGLFLTGCSTHTYPERMEVTEDNDFNQKSHYCVVHFRGDMSWDPNSNYGQTREYVRCGLPLPQAIELRNKLAAELGVE